MTSTMPKITMPILPGERWSFWSSKVCDAVAIVIPQVRKVMTRGLRVLKSATIREDCYGSVNNWQCLYLKRCLCLTLYPGFRSLADTVDLEKKFECIFFAGSDCTAY